MLKHGVGGGCICVCECLCVCERLMKKERKRWLLLPRQPTLSRLFFNPFSSAPPFHILSFTTAAISHMLMFYHSICPSLYLHAAVYSPALSFHACFSPCNTESWFVRFSVSPSTRLFILMSAHLSFCLHTCSSTLYHSVLENSQSLC